MESFDAYLVWVEDHDGLAAWFQAIFSVLAIFAAYMLARHQLGHAKRLDDERRKVDLEFRLALIDGLTKRIFQTIESLVKALSAERLDHYLISSFDYKQFSHYKASLMAIPFMEIPYVELVEPFADLPQAMQELIDIYERSIQKVVSQYGEYDIYRDGVTFVELLLSDDLEEKSHAVLSLVIDMRMVAFDKGMTL
nr:hypothetical protein [Janthinobacterium sp. Marseille]